MPAGLQALPPERVPIAVAAALSETVYYYPLPLALLLLLRAQAQGFQLMLNTELLSYVSLIFRFED
jgi:hypothetical protein